MSSPLSRLLAIDSQGRIALIDRDAGRPDMLVLSTLDGEAITLRRLGDCVAPGGLSPWERDTGPTPDRVELVQPTDTVSVSSSGSAVPAGTKILLESTPTGTGAVLEARATGQASAPYPSPGSAVIRAGRTRTAAAAFPEFWSSVEVNHDNFAGDAFSVQAAVLVRANQSAVATCFNEGIYLIGNADGNNAFFDRALATIDSNLWISADPIDPTLPPPNIWIFAQSLFVPGAPSGYVRISSGDTDAGAIGNIELRSGINTTVPAGPHGSVAIASRAAAQIPLWVRGFALQSAELCRFEDSTGTSRFSIGPAGQAIHEALGAAAGSDSSQLLFRCVHLAATHEWTVAANGDPAAQASTLAILPPGGAPPMFELRNNTFVGTRAVGFFGVPNATQTGRPGAITDNTGAADTGIFASLTAGLWDAAQVQLVEEALASIASRLNALEQKNIDLGLFI